MTPPAAYCLECDSMAGRISAKHRTYPGAASKKVGTDVWQRGLAG